MTMRTFRDFGRGKNRRGDVFMNMVMLAVAAILVFAFFYFSITHSFKRFMEGPSVDPQFQAMVDDWKSHAPIVVVGTIDDIREQVNEKADKETESVMSFIVMTLNVEQIERGSVNDVTIPIYFGWISGEGVEEDIAPKSVNQNYQHGDRVRIYLDYDAKRYGYFTPWSYFTLEPVD
jgi:hypothetical protein